jgi:hypothetical protein
MKINLETLKEYVQKSKLFMFPLVNAPKELKPIETYLGIKGLKLCDGYSLVMLYYNQNPKFQTTLIQLEKNKFFDFEIKDDEFSIVVFDLSSIKFDYERIKKGQYSKVSKTAKILINVNNTDEKASMGVNPEYYYNDLAELLQYPLDSFENTEIISPPDMDNEMLNVRKEIFEELKNEYLIPEESIYF